MYWAKPDEFVISDTNAAAAPPDPFKTSCKLNTKKNDLTKKITEVNLFTQEDSANAVSPIKRKAAKWTSTVCKFWEKKIGAYEENPNNRSSLIKKEMEPLYSSFHPDNVFVDPLTNSKSKQSYYSNDSATTKTLRTFVKSIGKTRGRSANKPLTAGVKQENLIARISMKKNFGEVSEVDTKKIIAMGIRTGGF